MARKSKGEAKRGSQWLLQRLVNERPDLVNPALADAIGEASPRSIEWLSPLSGDGFAEYSDEAFLEKLGISLPSRALESFWPKGGPEWDALARTASGKVVLVEAKAHISEAVSPASQASPKPLQLIRASLDETKQFLNSKTATDWSGTFYQYTNRLAHLYLLRELNDIPAYLVFLYFTNASGFSDAATKEEWQGAIRLLDSYLGVGRHKLSRFVCKLFVDAKPLE